MLAELEHVHHPSNKLEAFWAFWKFWLRTLLWVQLGILPSAVSPFDQLFDNCLSFIRLFGCLYSELFLHCYDFLIHLLVTQSNAMSASRHKSVVVHN